LPPIPTKAELQAISPYIKAMYMLISVAVTDGIRADGNDDAKFAERAESRTREILEAIPTSD
jgi:hypothetical protein